MDITLISILGLGFILGIKHAIEPDHVIAVSTIASQSRKLWQASLAGVFWGIGHTATLFIIGIILIMMKNDIPEKWSMTLEFFVGIMLVYLGVASMLSLRGNKGMQHQHEELHNVPIKRYTYYKSLIVGFIHGLAGSAAMVILTMSTVNSVWEGAIYIVVFGLGTVIGMLLFTTIIGIPFILSMKRTITSKTLLFSTGVISTGFGIYYMYNLGVNDGLFSLWV